MIPVLHQHADPGPVALLGCVYGNVPALRACLEDATAQGATLRIFLGDITGMCGHSDETVDLVRHTCEVIIAGNHDVQAAMNAPTCACGHQDVKAEQLSCIAHQYAMTTLSDQNRVWMASLPIEGRVDLPWGRIRCCHGSPDRINEFLYENSVNNERLLTWLEETQATTLACTHTGFPWIRHLATHRLAINCGAAGAPDNDGDPAVHYALLQDGHAEIRRVCYDYQGWVHQILKEGAEPRMVQKLFSGSSEGNQVK